MGSSGGRPWLQSPVYLNIDNTARLHLDKASVLASKLEGPGAGATFPSTYGDKQPQPRPHLGPPSPGRPEELTAPPSNASGAKEDGGGGTRESSSLQLVICTSNP